MPAFGTRREPHVLDRSQATEAIHSGKGARQNMRLALISGLPPQLGAVAHTLHFQAQEFWSRYAQRLRKSAAGSASTSVC